MTMRLGVCEREPGGVASVLGPPKLFPVPGPKACVLAGERLVPPGSCELRAHTGHGRVPCRGLGTRPGERRWRCGNF